MERLKSHRDFVHVLKRRTKVTSRDLVVHFCRRPDAETGDSPSCTIRLGLAVSKSVGHAVTRNLVKRRFRVLARAHEDLLPSGCDIVMRAKPSAAHASFQSLDGQVESLFGKAAQRLVNPPQNPRGPRNATDGAA